jgi:dipeptidyl aminopeptidase/acylaminoacyl peptidase
MDNTVVGRRIGAGPIVTTLGLAALVLLVGALNVIGPGREEPPVAPGPASNGRIVVIDGSKLRSHAADGTDPKIVATLGALGSGLVTAPDGSHVAVVVATNPAHMAIVSTTDGSVTSIPMFGSDDELASRASWSPKGDRIAYVSSDGSRDHLVIAPIDGAPPVEIGADLIDPSRGIWNPDWSPDGAWIAFVSADLATETGTLERIRTDGQIMEAIDVAPVAAGHAIHWSPDPATERILYTRDRAGVGLQTLFYDIASGDEIRVADTFWPSWAPDGERIAVWGTKVAATDAIVAGTAAWTAITPTWLSGSCQEHSELAGQSFCGPVQWSPDGTRVIAPDITGEVILSVLADGSGQPIVIQLETHVGDVAGPVAVWQPMR